MLEAVSRRAVQVAIVVLLASFLVFSLLQLVPGDMALTLAGDNATVEQIEALRRHYRLDDPFFVQYWSWLSTALQGDLSKSILTGVPVWDIIVDKMPATILIVVFGLFISFVIGVPLAILSALRPGSLLDRVVSNISGIGIALPNFWLAMILSSLFAVNWRLFPATGAVPISEDFGLALWYAFLPALALSAGGIAEIARQLRSALGDILRSPFVRTLHAKGLPYGMILWKHGLKNAGITLLTVVGLLFNRMLGATVVIEAVFAIPGIGSTVVQAAIGKDHTVVQGVVLVLILLVVATNFIVDMLYAIVDPRVRIR
jgi:peptide/nickel transport system permease protein